MIVAMSGGDVNFCGERAWGTPQVSACCSKEPHLRGSVRASVPHTSPVAAFEEAPVLDPSPGQSHRAPRPRNQGRGAYPFVGAFSTELHDSSKKGPK